MLPQIRSKQFGLLLFLLVLGLAGLSPWGARGQTKSPALSPEVSARQQSAPLAQGETPESGTSAFWRRELPTSAGESKRLVDLAGTTGTLLVFLSSECPISNGYVPALNAIAERESRRGVTVIGLNPNDGQSLRDVARHAKEFAIAFPVLKDAGARVASDCAATTCPEVFLFDSDKQLVYRGRIDDRYTQRGKGARDVRQRDLDEAVERLHKLAAAGETKPKPAAIANTSIVQTEPIGCPIAATTRKPATAGPDTITYTRHIAPLLQQHCQSCHRPNGIGPFSLLTYDQAVAWSDDLRTFTKDRTMPPWKPIDGHGDFLNRRALGDDEIELIAKWVRAGCPEGDAKHLPPPRTFPDTWTLGQPDVTLALPEPFTIPAEGRDIYQCFVLPTHFDDDLYLSGIEVLPGNTRVVHHVIAFVDTSNASLRLDKADPALGYSTSAGFPGFFPAGGLGGWAPGNLPGHLPPGMAKVLPKGAKVVLQVHYHPSGKLETDRTQVGLFFAKPPITRSVRSLMVAPLGGKLSGMTIPPEAADHEVKAHVYVTQDVVALRITPHMHLLGKDMKVTATLPDGSQRPLVWVNNWDFNWQEGYQFREPVELPEGTRIDLVAHFDNSSKNPHNPNSPPKTVTWGEQTADEMCIAFLETAPKKEAGTRTELRPPTTLEQLRDALLYRARRELFPAR